MKNIISSISPIFTIKRRKTSIKDKIRYTLIGLCIFILAVFFGISYFYTTNRIQDLIVMNNQEIAAKQFDLIQHMTEKNIEIVEKISQHGSVIRAANNGAASAELRDYLAEVMIESGEYEKIGLIDKNGAVIYTSDNKNDELKKSGILNEIRGKDDVHICTAVMIRDKNTAHYVQPVSFPVHRGKGDIAGYIVSFINMNILDDQLKTMDLGKKGNAFLVDNTGRVLCSSGDFQLRKNVNEFSDYYIVNTEKTHSEGFRMIDRKSGKLVHSIRTCLKTDHAGFGIYNNHENRSVIGIWKWYSYFKWIFLIELDKGEAFAPIANTLYFYSLIGVVFILSTVVITSFLSRAINRPIAAFIRLFSKGASGDVSVRFPLPDISSKSINHFEDGKYIEYEKSRGFCYFEIGSMSRILGKEASCRLLREKVVESCEECRIYKIVMHNEISRIGAWYNMFMVNLQNIIRQIQEMIKSQLASSTDMKETTVAFSENASNQAAYSEEIMATVEELFAGFDNVVDGTIDQYQSLKVMILRISELSGIIDNIGKEIKATQMGANDIALMAKSGGDKLTGMNSIMSKIFESSNQMIKIINIINDISEQINLLALNASIEAARAEEFGRGFAVVADEISQLADQTASSVKQIGDLIKINNDEINRGMMTVSDSVGTLQSIIVGFNKISDMLMKINQYMEQQSETNKAINEEMNEVRAKSESIKNSTEEQKVSSDEIIKSIASINELSQKSAEGAEKIAQNADNAAQTAASLSKSISFFKN